MTITNKPSHIREYIEGTIERLGFAPDLYYLHRIDPGTMTIWVRCVGNSDLYSLTLSVQTRLWKSRSLSSTSCGERARQSTLGSQNARPQPCAKHTQVRDYSTAVNPDTAYLRTHAFPVAKIDVVQAEYSAFETVHETDGLIDACRELGVAYVAYGPLGHGWLVDDFAYNSPDDFAPNDYRRSSKPYSLCLQTPPFA